MEHAITGWKRYALVQPSMMMLIFAQALSSNIFKDLIVYRTCSITFSINKTECLLLHENSSSKEALKLDALIQPKATLILMTKSIVESVIPALLSLFLGPWSDVYGRKPIMVLGYIGTSLTYLIVSFISIFDISPWFLLIAYIPYACLGGFCIILLGTICYITDISDEQERGWQLAYMQVLISVGILTGILAGPVIFQAYGYTIVFAITTVCCILASLHIYFLVPDTTYNTDSMTLKNLFNVHLVKKLISTCTKKRDGFDRNIVWCCITSIILMATVLEGNITVEFLFTTARLGWDVTTFSIYVATNIILSILGIIAIKFLVQCGGFSEEMAAILSSLSSLSSCIVESLTFKSWHMYLSAVVGMFGGIASPMIRAILSKSVPPEDTGKVFSMTISIETLTPLVASSLYTMIYSYFMPPMYPLPVWLVSGVIYIIVILILINIQIRNVKSNSIRYTPLSQDDELSS
ncbi:Proton-coupled folate transporter [Habropoda laboriosa]|uniref:Proton-coupled folate transporter n=1 Tax=Habropoda laboriosa TaxID=597456 RepID=A0A0L7QX12_9HYME|nr:PREDICTED: proton-coupled folate transporter-like [Habropoda laboriosa]KOC63079.1 Proton-coupled folate transporter [Habropoda laboriosa]